MPPPSRSATLFIVCVPAVAFIMIVAGLITGPFSKGYVGDGTVIAIKNANTGKYLSVSQEDGLVRVTHSSSAATETHFRVVALSTTTVSLLQPAKVRRPRLSKKLCACSGSPAWPEAPWPTASLVRGHPPLWKPTREERSPRECRRAAAVPPLPGAAAPTPATTPPPFTCQASQTSTAMAATVTIGSQSTTSRGAMWTTSARAGGAA